MTNEITMNLATAPKTAAKIAARNRIRVAAIAPKAAARNGLSAVRVKLHF